MDCFLLVREVRSQVSNNDDGRYTTHLFLCLEAKLAALRWHPQSLMHKLSGWQLRSMCGTF
jgi:hypothetical protein